MNAGAFSNDGQNGTRLGRRRERISTRDLRRVAHLSVREAAKAFALEELISGRAALADLFWLVPVNLASAWTPKKIRHYPRTTDEARRGLALISRVRRAA